MSFCPKFFIGKRFVYSNFANLLKIRKLIKYFMSQKDLEDNTEDLENEFFTEQSDAENSGPNTSGDDSSANDNATDGEEKVEDEVEKLKKELDEQKEKYIRLFAEFDNYKRRTSRESMELRLTASKDLMISLLEVLDDMDRAEEQIKKNETDPALAEGTLLIFNKLRKVLESKGLKAFETLHTEFDVEKDEAISEIPVTDKKLKGKVVAEVQKGYLLNDKLIRFAKVVVGT